MELKAGPGVCHTPTGGRARLWSNLCLLAVGNVAPRWERWLFSLSFY